MRFTCWITKVYGHTLRICDIYCPSTATVVTRTHRTLSVLLITTFIIQRMRFTCWITKVYGRTLRICDICCPSTATMVTRTHRTLPVLLITTFCAESVNRGMLNFGAMQNMDLRRRLNLPQVYQLLEVGCKGKLRTVHLASPRGRSIRRSIDSFIYDLSLLSSRCLTC